jgi:hypothetical protein
MTPLCYGMRRFAMCSISLALVTDCAVEVSCDEVTKTGFDSEWRFLDE